MYHLIPTVIMLPPPWAARANPRESDFLKNFNQIPHYVGESHRQIPQGAGKKMVKCRSAWPDQITVTVKI